MHSFSELILRSNDFLQSTLKEAENKIIKELETSGATIHIKNLQMINLQKAFFLIGVFSYYEALLQERLDCKNGFEEAKNILKEHREYTLLEKFKELQLIINILKHGKGRSYHQLLKKSNRKINISIKSSDEFFFNEGDVSEVSTLIKINNEFLQQSIEIINETSQQLQKHKPGLLI